MSGCVSCPFETVQDQTEYERELDLVIMNGPTSNLDEMWVLVAHLPEEDLHRFWIERLDTGSHTQFLEREAMDVAENGVERAWGTRCPPAVGGAEVKASLALIAAKWRADEAYPVVNPRSY